jgi:carboxymethylenebutenolidase
MPKRGLNHPQSFLVEEFVKDFHDGRMSRRDMVGRVLHVTGGIAATATLLLGLGCTPQAQPTVAAGPASPPKPPESQAPDKSVIVGQNTPGPNAGGPYTPTPATKTVQPSTPGPRPTPGPARGKLSVRSEDPAITAMDITFPGKGASIMGYLARPTTGEPFRAVLVCHDDRGLVEHYRDITRRLAKAGYVGLAVDLLSREGGTAKVDPAQIPVKLAADPSDQAADFQAGMMHLQSEPFVAKDKIGMVGFSLGGGVAWLVASVPADPMSGGTPALKAAVVFYGPPPPVDDVPRISTAVLAIYGADDQKITATLPATE